MASTLGRNFRLTTFGESHGLNVGGVVDGCPAGLAITDADLQKQLDRRRPGQSTLTTPRGEKDRVRIISGTENGVTLGSPIAFLVDNEDRKPGDYSETSRIPRPSHADFTYRMRYGVTASSGGGRASARETIGRVGGGAIAERFLQTRFGTEIVAWVSAVGDIQAPEPDVQELSRETVDQTPVRSIGKDNCAAMVRLIESVRDAGDSIGGIITCVCRGVPAGLGDPVFDKTEALLARAMLSLPATKGFEFGSGFAGTRMRGSGHNDPFVPRADRPGGLGTATNHSGGIQGGITNGELVIFRVAFKPVATILQPQQTADYDGNATTLEARGRHDPCVLPRAVPIVESMAALVLADLALTGERAC